MSLASFPGQCPGNEARMLAECHRSHDYVFHKIVFSLPVWTQVLMLTISRMMSCGWILSTPMAKGSVQCQSVVKCVVWLPDHLTGSCEGLGMRLGRVYLMSV